jgi:hypothetical protein
MHPGAVGMLGERALGGGFRFSRDLRREIFRQLVLGADRREPVRQHLSGIANRLHRRPC